MVSGYRLDSVVWSTIKTCDICIKTRGTTAGRFRRIHVFTINRTRANQRSQVSTVNTNNLINVHRQDIGNKLDFGISLMNCQSMCNKTSEIMDYVVDHDADVLALTETWLSSNDLENTQVIGDVT